TAMGGGFATAGLVPADFFPGHGAVAGLVKTLAREWPRSVRVRVVDLDPLLDVELLAADLVQEVEARDGCAEVGYVHRRRMVLRAVEAALPDSAGLGVALAQGEPLLITGGARGITAAVAADLARRWRPTLLLVGTSPLPSKSEEPATRGVTAPAELKTILHQVLARGGMPVSPPELERAYQALRRQREIRENLKIFQEAGATVEYARADVRDAETMHRVLDRWRERFGPIAGLIHGAGVIQDKLLRDKTPESFDRVLGTKVEGALTLARLVAPESLRFAAFFSSVAGRFGNRGQADYAAANEALNKLAIWLDRRWPGRVVSMIWGPWSGVGMVSDLEDHLGRRGLGMIVPELGALRLADELSRGTGGDVEVVVAGDLGSLEDPAASDPTADGDLDVRPEEAVSR
ncbi:MAG: SDR family NAD(P)-dependent oxidoreductase, partial [Singulisphaera sp.]|nr:SDR family NAD(P)-dependent oxidoreductase [Singulisphaera sp.]